MVEIPRGTVTFLFTDIVSSTRLWQNEPAEMNIALRYHDELVRSVAHTNDGHIFSIGGDGFGVGFHTANAAATAASELSDGLADHRVFSVRMGLHTGEPIIRDGNYFGNEVNRAARIMSVAHGGQTLLSGTTAALITETKLTDLGHHRLKDHDDRTELFQLGAGAFPPPTTARPLLGNLPRNRTTFVGRHSELTEIIETLDTALLVTLIGPGGMGKTRLSIEAASVMAESYSGGVWQVQLANVDSTSRITGAMLDAVGLKDAGNRSAEETLQRWFSSNDVLLVLDNCEHVIEQAADIADLLLAQESNSRILATSQAPLFIDGEQLVSVGPLQAGGPNGSSEQLFVDRAMKARSDFVYDESTRPFIAEICERLDHLPLAIELAASRVRGMSPAEIAAGLDQRFSLLAGGSRSAPDRHKTLENAIRWPYELLDPKLQTVLQRLSVFVAPFTAHHAEQVVIGDGPVAAGDIQGALLDLVDRSLLVAVDSMSATRFYLLESVKQFGRAELVRAGDFDATNERYVETFQQMAIELGHRLLGPDDQPAFVALDADWQNIQSGIQCAASDQSSARFEELFAALAPLWTARGRSLEGADWAQILGTRPTIDPGRRVAALVPAASVLNSRRAGEGRMLSDEAEALAAEHGTAPPLGAIANRALEAMLTGDEELARRLCDEVIARLDELPVVDWNRYHAVTNTLGVLSVIGGDVDRFRRVLDKETANAREHGSDWYQATIAGAILQMAHKLEFDDPRGHMVNTIRRLEALGNMHTASQSLAALAAYDLRTGNVVGAAAAQERAIEISVDHAAGYLEIRFSLAAGVLMTDQPDAAAQLLGFLATLRETTGVGSPVRAMRAEEFFTEVVKDNLGDRYDRAFDAGSCLTEDDAINLARSALTRLQVTESQATADVFPTPAS